MPFREVQRFRQWWVWVIAALAPLAVAVALLQEALHRGALPPWPVLILLIVIAVGVPSLFWVMTLTVTVDDRGIYIHYYPFIRRYIAYAQVDKAYVRKVILPLEGE